MDNKNLIIDLGFFNGDDTAYYLHKGFSVVAIEANTHLYELGLTRFAEEIKNKKLTLLNNAFCDKKGGIVNFYLRPSNLDHSTCDFSKTFYWEGEKPIKCEVKSITYDDLIMEYGMPYYIKCDIEGLDYMLIKQISESKHKPQFLSFELSRIDYFKIFSYIYVSGYTTFQLINQISFTNDGDFQFTKYSSGSFGKFLKEDNWLSYDECLTRYMKYKELKAIDNKNLALGWVDLHAKLC